MGNNLPAVTQKYVETQIAGFSTDFAKSLPKHIPSEKFERILITAISNSPELKKAMAENPRSVMNAALKAAQDGLIPDGREAAMVVFNSKDKATDTWLATAVYMPMVQGLMKLVRQSGDVAALYEPQIVYENDKFEYEMGFDPILKHTPSFNSDRGEAIGAYAVAVLDDTHQTKVSIVLTMKDIAKIQNSSKTGKDAKFGPWKDWWEEMVKKSAMKRLCKYLPSSSDIDAAFERDDTFNVKTDGYEAIIEPEDNTPRPEPKVIEHATNDKEIPADPPPSQDEEAGTVEPDVTAPQSTGSITPEPITDKDKWLACDEIISTIDICTSSELLSDLMGKQQINISEMSTNDQKAVFAARDKKRKELSNG